ncbi:MAG TPA: VanZ family protein [Terriglobales bacterium]
MQSHQRHVLKVWIAAGLWIGIIVVESTNYLSSDNTSHYLYPLLHFLFGISLKTFAPFHAYLRKAGHFVGYFILSLLLFRAWRETLPSVRHWTARWAGIAFLMSAFVASMDEWHQTFLPSRTGTIHDVLLDSSAALTAQVVIGLFLWFRFRREPV